MFINTFEIFYFVVDAGSQPEELNKKALAIISRVRDKLTGVCAVNFALFNIWLPFTFISGAISLLFVPLQGHTGRQRHCVLVYPSVRPFIRSFVSYQISEHDFWQQINQFWCQLAQMICRSRAWNDQLWGQRSGHTRLKVTWRLGFAWRSTILDTFALRSFSSWLFVAR